MPPRPQSSGAADPALRAAGRAALARRLAPALLAAAALGALAAFRGAGAAPPSDPPTPAHLAAFATITEPDVRTHLEHLAGPGLEGRDTPSAGFDRAAAYVAERFAAAGLVPLEGQSDYRVPFELHSPYLPMFTPEPGDCALSWTDAEGGREGFVYGTDFVPLPLASGAAEGPVVFLGFGIRSKGYNDLKGKGIRGSIALIVEGEPDHPRRFDGPEVTRDADVYRKLANLEEAGAAGVLIVRRPPAVRAPEAAEEGAGGEGGAPAEAEAPARLPLGFRHTWATWNVPNPDPPALREVELPALEIHVDVATRILGEDVRTLIAEMDAEARPLRRDAGGRRVSLSASSRRAEWLRAANLVGVVPGTDPALAGEYVIVGAHLDHVGVGPRTRIGFGADDNASGTAAAIEMAEAFGASPARRSVVVCAFAGEEDGLLGSRNLVQNLPMKTEDVVAMLNLDMIGRGPTNVVAVLGVEQNPSLKDVLKRAREEPETGVRKFTTKKAQHLFDRSDHYSFHQVGIPVLFFFEDPKGEQNNEDYHTWRDTLEELDFDKTTRTTRFAFNTAWLLANDDDRPPPPKR